MFEFFKRLVSGTSRRGGDDVVFLVNLPEIPDPPTTLAVHRTASSIAAGPDAAERSIATPSSAQHLSAQTGPPARTPSRHRRAGRRKIVLTPHESTLASHRARLLAMQLEHLNLCPATRCRQLAEIGIQTAGDLIYGDLSKIVESFRSPQRAERAIRRYRAAIKLALGIESMMPRDALLLVAIHRRSVASLARESAAQLHRDLERFSLSSRGSKLIGHRSVPSLRRVKTWVASCREMVESASTGPAQIARQAA